MNSRILTLVGFLALCNVVHAQLAGYNVDIGDPTNPGGVPASSYGAAAGQAGHWNALRSDALDEPLLDLSGGDEGVTASSSGGYPDLYYNNSATTGNAADLLDDFQDSDNNAGPVLWSIDGLEPGAYLVLVYVLAPDGASFKTDVFIPQSVEGPKQAGGSFANGFAAGVTHTIHSVDVGLSGELSIVVSTAAHYATVGGFQIVPLEDITFGEANGDQFGRAVANVGDVDIDGFDDFVVAAPFSNENGVNSGKIYLYSGQTKELVHAETGAAANDQFGAAVAAAGDINGDGHADFIVGAPFHDQAGNDSGAAYVYSGSDFSLLFTKVGQDAGDRFGASVAGGADVNDDGFDDFVVGAPYNDAAGSSAGRAYVYSGVSGAKLKTLNGDEPGDKFGWAVAMLDRANGDAFGDFVVSAPYNDDEDSNAGKVYVYSGQSFSLLHAIEGHEAGDQFGRGLAAAGLVNADGRDDFVVGSPYYNQGNDSNRGRIDVYSGKTGGLLWNRTGQEENDRFGWSVGGPGDVDGDGRADIITAGPWHDAAEQDAGRVQVRSGADGTTIAMLDGALAGDQFGFSVAGLSDTANTGYNDLLVGAPYNALNGPSAGQMYIVSFGSGGMAFASAGDDSGQINSSTVAAAISSLAAPADELLINAPFCPLDFNGDGAVDALDLPVIIDFWGPCDQCPADVTGDGIVDSADAALLLKSWGDC